MKRLFSNFAVLLITSLVVFGVGEVIVRSFFGTDISRFPRMHTQVQYGDFMLRRVRPNSNFRHTSVDGSWEFVTNDQGHRNTRSFSYSKTAGTLRVLALGDSHTQGYEVRQQRTFAAVIERRLNAQGIHAEVINAGVSGFSTAEELVFLENEGLKYQPDIVVVGFYRNDLEDNLKAGLFTVDDAGELQVVKNEHIPGVRVQNFVYAIPGSQWLGENSYFYSVLFNAAWEFAKGLMTASQKEQATEYAVAQQIDYSEYQLRLGLKLLERLNQICEDNSIKFLLIDIPAIPNNDDIGKGFGAIRSSFPSEMQNLKQLPSSNFVDSIALLQPYEDAAELHLPNGQRHISEFTHTIIGVAAANKILALIENDTTTVESEPSEAPKKLPPHEE